MVVVVRRGCSGVIRHGSAKDLADHGTGYSANGESQFSRQAASAPNVNNSRGDPALLRAPRHRDRGVDPIAFNQGEATRIRNNIRKHADNPEKVAALKAMLERKLALIEQLRAAR